ncbi:MAG: fluoride efflux transporter FluC [Bacillota bacterium]
MNIISVGIGGILGALARYFIYIPLNSRSFFPWGTLTVNMMGSFFLVFFLTVALRRFPHRSSLVLGVSTGFTGAFTTFSSVSVEAVKLLSGNPLLGLFYVLSSFLGGLLLAYTGRHVARRLSAPADERLE